MKAHIAWQIEFKRDIPIQVFSLFLKAVWRARRTELNNDKWYVTAQRMGTWAQARAVQNGFDSQVNIFLVFKLEK